MEELSPTPKGPLIELHVTSPLVEPPGSTSSGVCLVPPVDGRRMPPPTHSPRCRAQPHASAQPHWTGNSLRTEPRKSTPHYLVAPSSLFPFGVEGAVICPLGVADGRFA